MKLRTTLALITAAVGFTALASHAQTTEWVGTAELRYTTDYVFRGDKKAGQSIQANVEFNPLAGHDGFFVGAWANQPFASERDFEFDLYGGYKYHYEGFVFDAGLIGYFYPEAGSGQTDYTYEFYVSATREIMQNWSASATIYYDVRLQALTFEAATGYRIPYQIEQFPASVDFSLFLGNSNVDKVFPDAKGWDGGSDGYSYYGATVSTSVWFTKILRATIGVQYGDTINKATRTSPYGNKGSDNLYGYAAVALRW